jgi:hypothetical protein
LPGHETTTNPIQRPLIYKEVTLVRLYNQFKFRWCRTSPTPRPFYYKAKPFMLFIVVIAILVHCTGIFVKTVLHPSHLAVLFFVLLRILNELEKAAIPTKTPTSSKGLNLLFVNLSTAFRLKLRF